MLSNSMPVMVDGVLVVVRKIWWSIAEIRRVYVQLSTKSYRYVGKKRRTVPSVKHKKNVSKF